MGVRCVFLNILSLHTLVVLWNSLKFFTKRAILDQTLEDSWDACGHLRQVSPSVLERPCVDVVGPLFPQLKPIEINKINSKDLAKFQIRLYETFQTSKVSQHPRSGCHLC